MRATKSPLGQTVGALHVPPFQVSIVSKFAGRVVVEAKALCLFVCTLVVRIVRVRVDFGVGPALVEINQSEVLFKDGGLPRYLQ